MLAKLVCKLVPVLSLHSCPTILTSAWDPGSHEDSKNPPGHSISQSAARNRLSHQDVDKHGLNWTNLGREQNFGILALVLGLMKAGFFSYSWMDRDGTLGTQGPASP